MSKKTRTYKQATSQRFSSPQSLKYPYRPQEMDALTMAQKVLLSPEIHLDFREVLQDMVCIDIQDVISTFFQQKQRLPTMNLTPLYASSFLYAHAPDFIYDRETGKKAKWGHQEVRWGTQCVPIQLPSDSYHIAQRLMGLPEKRPRWFDQVHWILILTLFLEVPEGKRRRCVGPVAASNVLIDATGSIISDDQGKEQLTCRITHEKIEDVLYWYSGLHTTLGPAPDAHKVISTMLAEHFCQNIFLSLLGYAFLHASGTHLLPKETPSLTEVRYTHTQNGRTRSQDLSLTGGQLLLKIPALQA